ncbi:Uncharacterised protein [Staphylococcus muscae]|uniref:Uncharacterized protein n=1 Tax=Staphylococcus muscae TaxID=1294 RepID=A0A240BRX3_9STAP|nr:Uncharacterised protein [Staphylococcus muscae]
MVEHIALFAVGENKLKITDEVLQLFLAFL